ncbi:unnamed protein product [Parascedosporium putredinis]|uniref:DHHA2 domain-containing protein n=1 Tax=Parascedosporium putredinis TaxID=1442378 RepID=A0A9P1M7L9_9PEZI|nr:unnamed protein product [Parascedosporium putredinis]CAI7987838.1 unnamed protein product [Parascedosporium putredinis]
MTAVLARVGLEPRDLLTLDDLPGAPSAPAAEDTRWYLVDHNNPTGVIRERYGARVVGCLDHHVDEQYVPRDSQPRVIETCGSCVSLVVEHCRDAWDALAREADGSRDAADADKAMALMALGVIFSDTVNLRAKDKVTPRDVSAVEYLEAKLDGTGYDRDEYCTEIDRVKRDLDGLSLRDILRKDYKEWVENGLRLGTCSVVQNIDYLVSRAGSRDALLQALRAWADEKHLDLVSVMTLVIHDGDGGYERQVGLWALNQRGAEAARRFEEASAADLKLGPFQDGLLDVDSEDHWGRAWEQGNLKNTRKQIAPMIREAMKATGSS